MAKKGSLGVIEFGDTPAVVGELRSWRRPSQANEINTTIMGTGNARAQPGSVASSLECSIFYEAADAGQVLARAQLANDTPQDVTLYPQGKTSGLPTISGKAFVMSDDLEADAEGAIEGTINFSFDENGVSYGTVP